MTPQNIIETPYVNRVGVWAFVYTKLKGDTIETTVYALGSPWKVWTVKVKARSQGTLYELLREYNRRAGLDWERRKVLKGRKWPIRVRGERKSKNFKR